MAPKTHARISPNDRTTSQSIASTSRRSVGGESNPGSTSRRSQRNESTSKDAIFQRAVDRSFGREWFDEDDLLSKDIGLKVWLDCDTMNSKMFRGMEWALISVVRPAGLASHVDPQKIREAENSPGGKPALKVVAKIFPWNDAPDSRHVSLSSALCSALGCRGIVGALVRIGPAPLCSPIDSIKALKAFPFQVSGPRGNDGLRFGGESTTNRDAIAEKIRRYYSNGGGHSLSEALNGPLTDGLILSNSKGSENKEACNGILIRFDPPSSNGSDIKNNICRWVLGDEVKSNIDVQTEIPNPLQSFGLEPIQAHFPLNEITPMIGIGNLIDELFSHMLHCSSVLLTGGLGSGKSSLVCLLGYKLRSTHFFHTSFFPCREMVTDETRVSTIKESLHRLFMTASWGARFGGRSVVILDDLDRLCPAEEELQVGTNNDRSRQISELVSSIVHQYCGARSEIVLLATAQSKENVNSMIVGGHVVREIISLKAPNKDARRRILQGLVGGRQDETVITNSRTQAKESNCQEEEAAWMTESGSSEFFHGPATFEVDHNIDFLDLAGQTDGCMPGDLVLLVSRAKSEALIRTVESTSDSSTEAHTRLMKEDFKQALKGFTPASLRNVTLQASTTTFDSIGGLHETRKILLETLQYPTTYAPIFAQCPLRLRSGLLLYGYPGCGKTLLASAVAGECGLNFISVKGPEILNKYIGASEKSVRDLFERAEAARPCVLFFDEFDSIAPKRGHDSTGVTDRVVNQLLTQMDGAEGLSGVYVLAATSRPDLIDPALLRPGRLDKSIICDLPNLGDRLDILQALSKNLLLSQGILNATDPHESLAEIARRTEGYSGADLQAVIYNAHLEAIQDFLGDKPLTMGNGTDRTAQQQQRKKNNSGSRKTTRKILAFRYGHPNDDDNPAPPPQQTKLNPRYNAVLEYLDSMKKPRRHIRVSTSITNTTTTNNNMRRPQQQGINTSSSKCGPGRALSSSSASTTTKITGLDSSSPPHHHNHHHHHDNHAQRNKSAIKNWENGDDGGCDVGGYSFLEEKEKVRIEWRHVQASMASTRKSISERERKRLAGIYNEFLVGRNGEMPSGQGSLEVGGRVSLM